MIARSIATATGNLTLAKLTHDHVVTLADGWRVHKPNTQRSKLTLLKRLLRHLHRLGTADLTSAVPRKPPYQMRTVIATPEEMARLLCLTPPWLRCFVLLCSQLGLRFMEAVRACPADWQQDTGTLTIISKFNQTRILPVTPELTECFSVAARAAEDPRTPFIYILNGVLAATGPNTGTLLRSAKKFVWPKWERWRKKLGINPQLTIHDLRRTRITQVYRDTLDIKLAQQFAGHTNIASTAFYLAPWDTEHVLRAIRDSAPPRGWQKPRTQ